LNRSRYPSLPILSHLRCGARHARYFSGLCVGLAISVTAFAAPPTPAERTAAQAEFAATCARCHNGDGTGSPTPGMPNFADLKWQAAHSDAELTAAIRNGLNGRMPAFGTAYSPAMIDALVVGVVREFGRQAAQGHKQQHLPMEPATAIEPKLAPPGQGAGPVVLGRVGVYTQHNDNGRTGANLEETVLTPANVNVRQFGLLFRHVVDDEIFAQPLFVPNLAIAGGRHNVVFVATVANTVYAFDADRDVPPYWQRNLGTAGSVRQHPFWCLDILGNMGIIGTPVIDPATGTLYLVALTYEEGIFHQRLHALDLATGAERPNSPVEIAADDFDPLLENQRPALLLSHGNLYVGYSSHCDVGPYHGFLFRFDPATLKIRGVLETCPDGDGGSLWQSGQGPAADADGNLYFATSNGLWDGRRNFSDSVLKLDPEEKLLDWFTPSNYAELNRRDHDINSSGAMLIPGTHEVMGAGKEGAIYLLDTDHLGHLGTDQALQVVPVGKTEINGGAVYWHSAAKGGLVYLWPQDAALHAFSFHEGRFDPQPLAVSAATSAYPGAMLSLSANGDRDGILWANATLLPHGNAHVNAAGVLRAYDANDITRELWNSNQNPDRDTCGRISKNAPPTVANGKVYLATFGALPIGTGALYVYGLLPAGAGAQP